MPKSERDQLKQLADGLLKNLDAAGVKAASILVLYENWEIEHKVSYKEYSDIVQNIHEGLVLIHELSTQYRNMV